MRADDFRETEAVILMSGIEKSYKDLKVLDRVDLHVQRGTIFALLGQNGAGKTTAIRILSTLLKPDAGRARIMGYDVVEQPEEVRKVISLTGQYAAVDELLTGAENMWMMGRLYHLSHVDVRRRTSELLEQFALTDAAHRIVRTYSGGMRRRLDLALSLIATPPILFLDEPTTGLDPRSRMTMWKIITDLVASGVTIFLTTQYLEEADQLAGKIAVIDRGRIIAEGTVEQLKQQVGKERVELVFVNHQQFEKARTVLGGQIVQNDEQKQIISVVIDGSPRHLKHILDRIEQATIVVDSISLRKPTLEDVFLTITGGQTSELREGEESHA